MNLQGSKKLLFITTHNLATNPRLVKEINLALNNGFKVTVILFDILNWSKELDVKLKNDFKDVSFYSISSKRTNLNWIIASLFLKIFEILNNYFLANIHFSALALNKKSWLLVKKVNKLKNEFDLIVAHNPGAFYPCYKYCIKKNIPFGIDIEDYHAGETNEPKEVKRIKTVLKYVLNKAAYISAASPQILNYTLSDANAFNIRSLVVLNVFPEGDFKLPRIINNEVVKIVWFSQYISQGRGLEEFIPALEIFESKIELHLIGHLDLDFYQKYLNKQNIYIHKPMTELNLNSFISEFDIGLAFENKESNMNRDLCLTNKIFTYLQGGLYILASKTTAQVLFMTEFSDHGICVSSNKVDIENNLKKIIDNILPIRNSKLMRFENASKISWDRECTKLLTVWNEILTNN